MALVRQSREMEKSPTYEKKLKKQKNKKRFVFYGDMKQEKWITCLLLPLQFFSDSQKKKKEIKIKRLRAAIAIPPYLHTRFIIMLRFDICIFKMYATGLPR